MLTKAVVGRASKSGSDPKFLENSSDDGERKVRKGI
jgi:hypothetical protein